MNIFLTFDYELFFGKKSGSLEKSILEPTNALLDILDKHNAKATFFVDSGYLIKLKEYSVKDDKLKQDLVAISSQIKKLSLNGHSIQLHIHPHWEDAVYENNEWIFDTTRFTLNDFSGSEVDRIVCDYKDVLTEITHKPVFAFRAGGWCIQPFSHVASAMKKHGVWLDSTVFYGGAYNSENHSFNFKDAPYKDIWPFNQDLLKETEKGDFIELPISSHKIKPWFYWKFLFIKIFKQRKHQYIGDGTPIGAGKQDIIKMLTQSSYGVASVDGYKISYLKMAFKLYIQKSSEHFVLIGHPKASTAYSLSKLSSFVAKHCDLHKFISVAEPTFIASLSRKRND
ncbi:polysaccharide deacetylase family protein [Psychromonas hadalis]|uniref:polysaccharide deacetylase family protein n=1 Tax=Psychromonas hadalis TaxID=211669 RepID=UPI0003B6F440|nr:polysaccharide deacetylase family protein [Psychromonas hadalis]